MRRSLVIRILSVGVILAVVLAPAAGAKKKKKPVEKVTRTESFTYSGSTMVAAPTGAVSVCAQGQGCFSLTAQPKEEYLSIAVTDSSGMPTPFMVSIDGSGGSVYCGQTDAPIWLNGATDVDVQLGVGVPDCPAIATSGTFDVTFSNLP